jgi:anti-sigma B factor antagonist
MGVRLMFSSNLAMALVFVAPSVGSGATERVAITGEVDLLSAGELERRLRRVVAESRCRTIVVDLGGLEFLDARGVSVLLATKLTAEEAGRDLQVTNAQGLPAKVLRLLGFESWCQRADAGDRTTDE